MRLIAQLSEVLARVISAKASGDTRRAQEILDAAYGDLLGLQGEIVERLTAATLADLLVDREKIKVLAALLYEDGNVLESARQPEPARVRFAKALQLYQQAEAMQNNPDPECAAAIETLRGKAL